MNLRQPKPPGALDSSTLPASLLVLRISWVLPRLPGRACLHACLTNRDGSPSFALRRPTPPPLHPSLIYLHSALTAAPCPAPPQQRHARDARAAPVVHRPVHQHSFPPHPQHLPLCGVHPGAPLLSHASSHTGLAWRSLSVEGLSEPPARPGPPPQRSAIWCAGPTCCARCTAGRPRRAPSWAGPSLKAHLSWPSHRYAGAPAPRLCGVY